MGKFIAVCAAVAMSVLSVVPAGAVEQRAPGAKGTGGIEVSAARRHHRPARITVQPWCGLHGRYCDAYRYGRRYNAPYAAYAYGQYYKSRPYWLPGPHVGFAPFDTGPYGFGSDQY